jgi:hypothetical protein
MKAEHRKELQTNTLADYLGRTVRSVRSGAGISWFKIFLIGVVVLGIAFVWWTIRNKNRADAENWAKIQYNDKPTLYELGNEYKDTKQGQAARFRVAFFLMWEGIKLLGTPEPGVSQQGLGAVNQAKDMYRELAEQVKDDPERLAEAKYHIFVAKEAFAILDIKSLDDAKKDLEELTKAPLASTAFGVLAKKRWAQYTNEAEFNSIRRFYAEYRTRSKTGPPGK